MDNFSPTEFMADIAGLRGQPPLHETAIVDSREWLERFWVYLNPALAQRAFALLENEAALYET